MRPIHPFPARMAPDTVIASLQALKPNAQVLDPMCGSGTVIRQAAMLGHVGRGFDIDPLAVLMSNVWTRKGKHTKLVCAATNAISQAKRFRSFSHLDLPWIDQCEETRFFVEYWFAEPQRSHLARLAWVIGRQAATESKWVNNALLLALSRIVVTKIAGASLAWDVSHSRPHRVRNTNDFDVYSGFLSAANRLASILDAEPLSVGGIVRRGDCRHLDIASGSVDAVVTSPPYLNAIDYLRGHKLALVWLGHTIPSLRSTRSKAIGTEKSGPASMQDKWDELTDAIPSLNDLPARQRGIVRKYASDTHFFVKEMRRVLKRNGLMVLVVGDSQLRGIAVPNSQIFSHVASRSGFELTEEQRRPLEAAKRYLPIASTTGALSKRMKVEVLQTYRAVSSS